MPDIYVYTCRLGLWYMTGIVGGTLRSSVTQQIRDDRYMQRAVVAPVRASIPYIYYARLSDGKVFGT